MTMYIQIPSRKNRKFDTIPLTAPTCVKRMAAPIAERFALTNRFDQGDRDEEVELVTKLVRYEPTPARNNCLRKMLTEVCAITLLDRLTEAQFWEAERKLREHFMNLSGSLP